MRSLSAASERHFKFILYDIEYSLHQRGLDCADINYFFVKMRQSATKLSGKSLFCHSVLCFSWDTESIQAFQFSKWFVEISSTQLLNGGDRPLKKYGLLGNLCFFAERPSNVSVNSFSRNVCLAKRKMGH